MDSTMESFPNFTTKEVIIKLINPSEEILPVMRDEITRLMGLGYITFKIETSEAN